jgi:peptidoglycan/xylan/chitin deacetylase (PgdA/CDA1 family)
MDDKTVPARPRAAGQLLTKSELTARRAASRLRRRRRRRRNAGVATVAVLAAAAAYALASSGGSPASHEARAQPVRAAVSPVNTTPAPTTPAHTTPAPPPHHRARPPAHRSVSPASSASVSHVLRYTSYVQLAGHRRREVALTFDDGPSPYTSQVLRILRRFQVHATFFVVGREVATYDRLVAAEAHAGNDVGDHTMSHPPLAQLSASSQSEQIAGDARLITAAGAPAPRLMRPPYGSFNTTTLQVLRAQRLLMVLWSVDTKDYARPGTSRIIYTAVSGAEPGAIILMHDGGGDRSETVAALPRIITRLRQRHFKLVTLSQLVRDDPPPRHQPVPHSLSGGV